MLFLCGLLPAYCCVDFLRHNRSGAKAKHRLCFAFCFAAPILFTLLPSFEIPTGKGIILFLCGIPLAAALILPGISTSHTMLLLGIYDATLTALTQTDVFYLILLGGGIAAGTLLFAKALASFYGKHPLAFLYSMTGFVLSGTLALIPDDIALIGPTLSVLLPAAGASAVLCVCFFIFLKKKMIF